MEWEKTKQGQRVQCTPTNEERLKAYVWRGHPILDPNYFFLLLESVTLEVASHGFPWLSILGF